MQSTEVADVPTVVLPLGAGRELAFACYGDPEGVPVFAFHGTPGSHRQLAPTDAAARAAGVRLIVPDRPGYGHSSFQSGRRLVDWPGDVAAIADHLGLDRFAVVGVSGGGPHAIACAALLPDRVTAAGTVSSPAPRVRDAHDVLRWFARMAAIAGLARLVATMLLLLVRRFPMATLRVARRSMPEADRRVVDDLASLAWFQTEAQRMPASAARAIAQDIRLYARDWRLPLDAIAQPVRIWHGTSDRLVAFHHAEVLASTVPTAALITCEGDGHLMFATDAEAILGEVAWLARPRAVSPERATTKWPN